jgi:hypothetical protein
VDREAVVEFRRRSYIEVVEICRDAGLEPLFDGLEEGICPYLVPIVVSPGPARERVERRLVEGGWRVSHWPDLPPGLRERPGDAAFRLRENVMAVFLRPAVI